jgi:FdhE protein
VTTTTLAAPTPEALAKAHPEWSAWLALLEVTAEQATAPAWAAAVPAELSSEAPGLHGATLTVERAVAARWLQRLFGASNVPALLEAAARSDALAVLAAAIELERGQLVALAQAAGAPEDAFVAVAPLAAVPWLQACGRRWAPRVTGHGASCPLCGAWATLAEARGLERERRLRCARCGGDWRTEWLTCPYCGVDDHARLTSLVADATGETRKVEACRDCTAYVKTVATLAAADAATLRLVDLATVDLDVAALERGFTRPAGLGQPLDVTVVEPRVARRFWHR